jgi:hypothetical protein
MLKPEILKSLISKIKLAIQNKNIDTSSAMKMLVLSMELIEDIDDGTITNVEKKQYIIIALEEIAKGNDMITGTSDDTISITTLESLRIIINKNLISEIVDIICLATKGEININKVKNTCYGCFSIMKPYTK